MDVIIAEIGYQKVSGLKALLPSQILWWKSKIPTCIVGISKGTGRMKNLWFCWSSTDITIKNGRTDPLLFNPYFSKVETINTLTVILWRDHICVLEWRCRWAGRPLGRGHGGRYRERIWLLMVVFSLPTIIGCQR